MSNYAAGLHLRKAMAGIMVVVLSVLMLYSHSVAAALPLIEVTGEHTMGDSDEQELAIAYASYYARQKAAAHAAAYVEAYAQEHALRLDKLSVNVAAARIIREQKHEVEWQKTDNHDFHVIVKAVYEVNTDKLAEYAKPADAQLQEENSVELGLAEIERDEASLREDLRHNQDSDKAKEITQHLQYNGRRSVAVSYANEALQATKSGNPRTAIACYTKAVNVLPDYSGAYCMRGELYDDLGEYPMAVEDFNRAIKINPVFDRAYAQRGYSYLNQKKYDLAIADFNKLLEISMSGKEPNKSVMWLAYMGRSMVYTDMGDTAKAVDDANMVISLLDSEISTGIGYYLRGMAWAVGGEADKAMDDYEKAVQAKVEPDMLQSLQAQIIKALQRAG